MSVDHDLGTKRPASTPMDYRRTFGWPVHWQNGTLNFVIGAGIGAVAVPRARAEQVLENLARQGCRGPALSVPTKHGSVVIFLVEADILGSDAEFLPSDVRVLTAGTSIPLPGTHGPADLARWIVAPDPHQRWLPSLTAVLAAIRSAGRYR
ncbi:MULTISPECIES: hypothetical protein [Amycolatopsis]|uniref:DNA primase/polymerase bifunctional N-terminal domain-containing protein n=1 Tax=Amycolatopsis thermalba TaxID=944492 RepID=A0ABY4NWA8_9PSEU|nr:MULTISPECIES: hypothetical protein [Amycolatopsis]OXM67431.1 hypothetical protein CF166_23710 [Amycolatopsis sp. KNN50.9b]UQS24330.1 hypothetical protein L1857_16590 [Amycolatopsis thermalba]